MNGFTTKLSQNVANSEVQKSQVPHCLRRVNLIILIICWSLKCMANGLAAICPSLRVHLVQTTYPC